MSEIENSLNALEEQTLFSAMTKEETNSFDQQQQYQEQQNMDNYSGETGETSSNSTPAELTEVPQSPTQLSSIESTISSPSTLEHNCNSSDSSNSSNSSTISSFSSTSQLDYDTPFNPISFLNTMHQKLKTSEAPVYTFSHDSVTGHFYCQVNFCGQTYENNNARPKKQQAKEEAASTAMKDLSLRMPEITDVIRQELIRARSLVSQKNKHGNNNKNHNQTLNYHKSYQPPELISKSLQWYNRQVAQAKSNGQEKRPCVLLLEFCQMHRIGHPTYRIRDDGRGYYYFDCTVFNRTFTGELAFWRKGDAKDHVSSIAFACLYREFFDKEQHEIQQSYGGIYGISPPLPPHPSNVAFSPIYPNVADANNYYSSYQ